MATNRPLSVELRAALKAAQLPLPRHAPVVSPTDGELGVVVDVVEGPPLSLVYVASRSSRRVHGYTTRSLLLDVRERVGFLVLLDEVEASGVHVLITPRGTVSIPSLRTRDAWEYVSSQTGFERMLVPLVRHLVRPIEVALLSVGADPEGGDDVR